ncbi:hypothetical protein Lmor_2244 [Legionella moravica]|uniref:Uncharacterized protein n=1 Tax=Legionella moravica TaxID=39962 RepID=A0A378JUS0_9GAMM|nr:hypothetical protein [Legionella moravica]KTD32306.1 hypothetical protein Lmor_2244 [Legionella moravica]STX62403.1 Uncharacterised protein [Legionella moravica]
MQLIPSQLLVDALDDFEVRKTVIEDLTLTPAGDEHSYSKWIMAFWLGSSVTRNFLFNSFRTDVEAIRPYLDWGYFCILTIDRHMSLLQKESTAYRVLHHIAIRFFLNFNEHFSSLQLAPKVIFYPLIYGFGDLTTISDGTPVDNQIVKSAKSLCLEMLSQLMSWAKTPPSISPVTTKPLFSQFSKSVFSLSTFKQNITRLLTSNCLPLHAFPIESFFYGSPVVSYKFLLPGHDGVLLEGVQLRHKEKNFDTTVLVLVGQVPIEHVYINQIQQNLPDFFNAEVILINHRNFSLHSSKRADRLQDIALDIISFAKHAVSPEKSLVLYGMCGGAGPMILAAERLMNQQIPFKIIIDRFAESYSSFLSYKTLKRRMGLQQQITHEVPCLPLFLWVLLDIAAYWLIVFALYCARTPNRFDVIVHQIPDADLLILQAKGPKTLQPPFFKILKPDSPKVLSELRPAYIDFVVHPDHDLRTTFKKQRDQKKLVLKTLKRDSLKLAYSATCFPFLESVFQRFSDFFDGCLQSISNEKLTLNCADNYSIQPIDIHGIPLTFLTTRNHTPISRFIYGFYSKPAMPSIDSIHLLNKAMEEALIQTLRSNHSDENSLDIQQFKSFLSVFLNGIKNNASLIGNLADRLAVAGKHNIVSIIQDLHHCVQQVHPHELQCT